MEVFDTFVEGCPIGPIDKFKLNMYYHRAPYSYAHIVKDVYNEYAEDNVFIADIIIKDVVLKHYFTTVEILGQYDNATEGWYEIDECMWNKIKQTLHDKKQHVL